MRSSKYTRDVLEPVVATSRSLAQVIRRLGLKPTGGNYRERTRDELAPLVQHSLSVAVDVTPEE